MARILIVEKDPFFSDVLACTLGLENHDVTAARTAAEGIRLGPALRPNLVIAAWWLHKDMHGGEVCRRIRAASPSTRVILITTRHEFVSQAREFCACVTAVLSKPFHRQDILDAVRRALSGNAISPPPHSLVDSFQDVAFDTVF